MTSVQTLCSLSLAAALAGCGTTGRPEAVGFPAHWALVRSEAERAEALHRIRDAVSGAIASTGAVPAGYPRPCELFRPEADGPPSRGEWRCREGQGSDSRVGLLLAPQGDYLHLALVDYPDSRLWFRTVYLVRSLVQAPDHPDPGSGRARVCISTPPVVPRDARRVASSIDEALRRLGAAPLGTRRTNR